MLQFRGLLLTLLIALIGCKETNDQHQLGTRNPQSWTYVIITANSQEFTISEYDDTLTIKKITVNGKDTLQKVRISKNEKDSLFAWTETLIQTKPEPTKFCTDYYGKLSLKIIYSEQVSRQIQYRSICEWERLDRNTSHIYSLINRRLTVH